MTTSSNDDLLSRLSDLEKRAAESDRLSHEFDRLTGEVTRLNHEVSRLRSVNAPDPLPPAPELDGTTVERSGQARRFSRSEFLRLGGATAAGVVAAGASGVLSAGPAAAATGQPLMIGQANTPTSPADSTRLFIPAGNVLAATVLRVDNASSTSLSAPQARVAISGTTSGIDVGLEPRVGVWGQTDDVGNDEVKQFGIVGRQGTTGADPLELFRSGVAGTSTDGGNGVTGYSNGELGWGVQGASDAGIGVVGASITGLSMVAAGGGRILQTLREPGPPTEGSFLAGEQIRDAGADMYICVADSVDGDGGVWRRVAAVKEGFTGGSVNFLSKPIRLLDTRSGPNTPLAAGATLNLQVTDVVVGGVSIPAGAVGVIGNVTVVATGGPGGYLSLFPQGSPPSPVTSSVNWFAANQVLNTAAVVGLNPATGQMGIGNGLAGGSRPTHVVFDASGFVF